MVDPAIWKNVPFQFWSFCMFILGTIVGSFLNVCIHRMPRGLSLVSPPSHCPNCGYSIPWYFNIPLVTWLLLRGKCANCRAPISARYFVVEFITGALFLLSWLVAGHHSIALAFVYCLFMAGLVVATFIDFEHFIIPDEITIGGIVVGIVLSLLVPQMHGAVSHVAGLKQGILGAAIGLGMVYAIVRLGKVLFGKQRLELEPGTRVIFTETAVILPGQQIPFEDIFYRKTDAIYFDASIVELVDRCYKAVQIRLAPDTLQIGGEVLKPEDVHHMEAVTNSMTLPREAMGLGDVKFMGAIGAFLGWKATLFSLMASSMIGAFAGFVLIILKKQEWSSRLPYGPYIALGAILWIFGGHHLFEWWLGGGWLRSY